MKLGSKQTVAGLLPSVWHPVEPPWLPDCSEEHEKGPDRPRACFLVFSSLGRRRETVLEISMAALASHGWGSGTVLAKELSQQSMEGLSARNIIDNSSLSSRTLKQLAQASSDIF